jgi:hypothetical protein
MLFLRLFLLWALIAMHVVGAAALFRRLFPRECPWLGYLAGPLIFLFVLNFIEHFVGLPSLVWLMPVTTLGFAWLLIQPGYSWAGLRLPTGIFLGSFAFVLYIKSLHPDIGTNSEALADLNRMLDYCYGETLPPTDSWLPPYNHQWYYSFMMYGASVVKRMFFLDLGTGYNISFALFIALIFVAGAGAAYYVSGRKMWVTLTTLFFIIATFTGGSAIIDLLTRPHPNVWLAVNLNTDWDNPANNPLTWFLKNDPYHEPLKLFPPGMWIWMNEYHPTLAGHFMTLCAVLATLVAFNRDRSNWPWIFLLILPLLTVISAAWYLLVVGFLCAGGLAAAWWAGRRPENLKFVIFASLIALVLIWPTLVTFTSWSTGQEIGWNHKEWRTPFWIFVIEWWPIYVPWFLLCFVWHRLNSVGRWFHAAVAIMFICTELFNVGSLRWDTTEKMWGAIYSAGLVTLIPLILVEKGLIFRFPSLVLFLTAAISLYCWLDNTMGWLDWKNVVFHTEGDSYMMGNDQMKRMLQVLQPYKGLTVLAGKSEWAYSESPGIAVFTENRCYSAWFHSENICGHEGEAEYRMQLTNDFYDGKLSDPLGFLEDNNISAVLIWPDNKISDDRLKEIKQELAPAFYYVDCRFAGDNNAGVFLLRSLNQGEAWRTLRPPFSNVSPQTAPH